MLQIKEKIIHSEKYLNWVSSAIMTSYGINIVYVISILVPLIAFGWYKMVNGFFTPDSEYDICMEKYEDSVEAFIRTNKASQKYCIRNNEDDPFGLKDCMNSALMDMPVNSCINKWEPHAFVDEPPENNLRKRFGLEDCRATNDSHRLGKYNLEWMAYDIACEPWQSFDVKSPWAYKIKKVWYWANLWDYIILVKYDNETSWLVESDIRIVLWHIRTSYKEWHSFKEGDIIWQTNVSWASTWYHIHIELWDGYMNVSREFALGKQYKSINWTALLNHRKWDFWQQLKDVYYFTSYNLWDVKQNDSTPCIGASGKDLCHLESSWVRTMALTSDIRTKLNIKFGDKVRLLGDEGCEWVFQVEDEMNKRFRQTPWVLRPNTPYYIKWDLPSKEGWVCSVTKI